MKETKKSIFWAKNINEYPMDKKKSTTIPVSRVIIKGLC